MKRLLTLGLLMLATPAMADIPVAPVKTEPAAAPLSVWRPVAAGAFENPQSGLVCPAKVGEYGRTDLQLYDKFGFDVSCNYLFGRTDITVYLTRRDAAEGVDAAMAEAKRELLDVRASLHPQALSDSRSVDAGLAWMTALYALDGGRHSAIWIADLNGWTLEYRATYPAAQDPETTTDLKRFTATVESSAGARLALCAKSTPPTRDGERMTARKDLEADAMMTSLLGAAALAAVQEGKGAEEPPTTWCAEAGVATTNPHMVFWRGVGPDGANADADEISLVSDGPPPTLDIASDQLASLVDDAAHGKDKPPRWTATMRQNDQTLIYAYFAGRPAIADVADLFAQILLGKAKAVGGYSAKGKNITILTPSSP